MHNRVRFALGGLILAAVAGWLAFGYFGVQALVIDDDRFVSLGALTGNIGSQNYEIPPEIDLATYRAVQIWCERFGVLFGDAPLA